jgi:DtxR family transcriptional regulator, Mn-dependent transcriptional regulator
MKNNLSPSVQDYLKAVYSLSNEGEASTSALASHLGVAPASVTGMLQKLAALQPSLVRYHKHRGAMLTPQGEKAALEVIRHHRLLEAYLVESLGYTWDTVHEEACKLEHVISEVFEERIAALLGNPVRDPHGAPIPSAALIMPANNDMLLSGLHGGEHTIIRRIRCEQPDMLRHLESLGLVPGAELDVLEVSPFDDNLTVQVKGQDPAVIGPAISREILVEMAGAA